MFTFLSCYELGLFGFTLPVVNLKLSLMLATCMVDWDDIYDIFWEVVIVFKDCFDLMGDLLASLYFNFYLMLMGLLFL